MRRSCVTGSCVASVQVPESRPSKRSKWDGISPPKTLPVGYRAWGVKGVAILFGILALRLSSVLVHLYNLNVAIWSKLVASEFLFGGQN